MVRRSSCPWAWTGGRSAEVGDTLVIDGGGMGGLPRLGTIIAVTGQDGSPPYLVRWLTGEYESRVLPGPGAHVEKHHPAPRRLGH